MGVLTFTPDLQTTISLLEAASSARIMSRRIRWQAMERVLRLLRGPFRESETNPLAVRELDVANRAWAWARICMDGPVPPNHPSTGVDALLREIDEAAEVLQLSRLFRLRDAISQVKESPHPAATAILNALTSAERVKPSEHHSHSVALIVRGEGLRGVTDWVETSRAGADVVTVSEARKSAPWSAAVLFGPPDRYTSSPWVSGQQATATSGWLITAPPATQLLFLAWTGHRPLAKEGYRPWQGAPAPEVSQPVPIEIVEDDYLPDSLDSFRPVKTPNFHDEGETVPAYGLQFLCDSTPVLAYFHPEIGPQPSVVTFDDNHVVLTRVKLRTMRTGRCVMLRTSIAGRDVLDGATEEWFREHRGSGSIREARSLQGELKEVMDRHIRRVGSREVVRRLQERGFDRYYASSLPARLLHPDFIAPQHLDAYRRLCEVLGLNRDAREFAVLKTLRTARRQAGLMLSTRIVERLDMIPGLADLIRDRGAVVFKDPGLEGVALLVVRDVAPDTVRVPAWRLGSVLTEEGHAWQP